MTKDQYDELFISIIDQVKGTRDEGQKEYAHEEHNVFANFERTARQLNTTRDKVLMTFLMKHMDGIVAHINGHTSQREDIRGRIKDSIVYLTLYWAMVEGEMSVQWDQEATMGVEEFLSDSGFIDSKPKQVFNPGTGEVSYQAIGDETI
jgi:hypothetical protein